MVNNRSFFSRLLPAGTCLLCNSRSADAMICPACRDDMPRLGPACHYCAAPLPETAICPACLRLAPPYRARAVFRYDYPLTRLIQQMKFHNRTGLARIMGAWLAEELPPLIGPSSPDALLAMPLHRRRQWQRGFNQALELAKPVAGAMNLPLYEGLARRHRDTRPQADLPGRQRRSNVHGAFSVVSPCRLHRVAVIDDVLTSGHTAAALAHCLRRAGIRHVEIWTLARAGLDK